MAVNLSPIWGAGAQLFDNSGNVLSGGKIYTYSAGTTTPAVTYTDTTGNTAHSNPIILNSAGRVPYEIWLDDTTQYKFVLKDSNDTLIGTWDNIDGVNSNFVAYTGQNEYQTAVADQTVFTLTEIEYIPGANNLMVFVDGINQYGPNAQYAFVETDSTTVTFTQGLHEDAQVRFTTATVTSVFTYSVLSGPSNPTSGDGVNGDFYINTTTYYIFGPKTDSGWGTGTSLVGPAGATGPAGPTGPAGAAATIAAGTTTTGAPGSSASVVNSGTSSAAVFDFTIPQGATGTAGNGIVSVTLTSGTHAPGTLDTYTILFTDGSTTTFQVYNGANGTGSGTVTSVDISGGTTGLTTSGGPITSTGTITLAGTLAVANGGTGQTSYTNGQLLIGNSTGNTLSKATLTAGTGVSITNGAGSITIAATGGTGDVVGPASATDNGIARFDGTTGKLIQNSAVTIDDAGNIISPDSVQFSGTTPVTTPIGTLWFDSTTDTLNLQQNAITQQIGEELFVYGKASAAMSGQTILQAVYKTGTVGASGVITFAPTIANITDSDSIIGIATEDIALNGFGRITSFGVVHGIDTTGSTYGETWADNDTIWYNPVTGGLTKTKPVAPYIKMQMGTVINAGSGGSGSFQVHIGNSSTLGGTDSNVQITTPTSGNTLIYDGVAGYWKNANLTAGTGVSVTNGAGAITITNSAPDQTVSLTAGTGISVSGTYPSFTVANTGLTAYPGSGIPVSTGSAWSTSKTAPSGDIVGTSDSQTLTNKTLTDPTVSAYTESVAALGTVSSSATIAITAGTVVTATLTASTACTFTMPTATAGKSFVLLLKQAASTGNGTATFTGVKWGTAGAPTITATAGKMDILTFVADGTNWYGSITQGYTP